MTPQEFLEHIKDHLARSLTASNEIRVFTDNTDLIGEHAEAVVQDLIARVVFPLKVSRGAIVHEQICPDSVPQLDAIVWQPTVLPALFDVGNFALIPRLCAIGFLEIKSSAYSNVGTDIADALEEEK